LKERLVMTSDGHPFPPVVARPATTADADAVAALLLELGYPTEPASVAARITRLAVEAGSTVMVAVDSSAVCGLATVHLIPLFHRDGSLARITSFVVSSSSQHCGVGTVLLTACETYARSHGAERLEVTSGDRRPVAHAFYEHRGFEREGVRMTRWLVEHRDRS